MIRKTLALAALATMLLSAAAQETAAIVHTIPVPVTMTQVELSPDGRTAAVYEHPNAGDSVRPENLPIYLVDVSSGTTIGLLMGAQVDLARNAAFSPDGTKLASYHVNGDLIVWDVATLQPIQEFDWMPIAGGLVDYLPDGDRLVVTSVIGQIGQHAIVDLPTESIVDILSVRPATYKELEESLGRPAETGAYGIASTAVGADGALYGVTFNGEVYVWDIDARTRTTLSPASTEGPLRFNVRKVRPLDDGSLAFYDRDLDATVMLAPDGTRTQHAFGGEPFVLNGETLIYYSREDRELFRVDLSAAAPEPEPLTIEIDGEDTLPRGEITLATTADGTLVLGGMLGSNGDNAIYVVELPE